MKPVFQTKFGEQEGNCFEACIASILEEEQIPESFGLDDDNWFLVFKQYMNNKGLNPIVLKANVKEVDKDALRGYSICWGQSSRGDYLHSVVTYNGEIVHDPHPSGGGLKDIQNYIVFVAINPSELKEGRKAWGGW